MSSWLRSSIKEVNNWALNLHKKASIGSYITPINYLFPIIGTPLFFALIRGDIKSMFSYADHPELDAKEEEKDTKKED